MALIFPELGVYALILALCLNATLVVYALAARGNPHGVWVRLARPLTFAQGLFLGFAYLCLTLCFLTNDFSVLYVANNSNSFLPLIYRLSGVWGAHEGSILLWITLLGVWAIGVAWLAKKSVPLPILSGVLTLLAAINLGLLWFLLATSNPFARVLPNIPSEGQDLNPLLQDPGLAFHPPMLYMGYVGFAVTYAFACVALMRGEFDSTWARWMKPWAIAAWCFLTMGITLGSWWAYRVLGWGGFWFWDPVENAALMPWISGTALFHSLMIVEKRNNFRAWVLMLSLVTFALSLIGTFLVRSGILTSVHAFANDPTRGIFMLGLIGIVIGISFLLYAWRAHQFIRPQPFFVISRETFLLLNNVLLMTLLSTVFIGTLYPLVFDVLHLGKISVGPPYFNLMILPIILPLFVVMGLGPLCSWQTTSWTQLKPYLKKPFMLALGMGVLITLLTRQEFKFLSCITFTLIAWMMICAIEVVTIQVRAHQAYQKRLGMMLAHLGVGFCALGILLTSLLHLNKEVVMAPGEIVKVGPYQFKFLSLREINGPNYDGVGADFQISKDGRVWVITPEKRHYKADDRVIGQAAIEANLWRDLYVALGSPLTEPNWEVRIYYKPFVRWIWLGGFLMGLGGVIALITKKGAHE